MSCEILNRAKQASGKAAGERIFHAVLEHIRILFCSGSYMCRLNVSDFLREEESDEISFLKVVGEHLICLLQEENFAAERAYDGILNIYLLSENETDDRDILVESAYSF